MVPLAPQHDGQGRRLRPLALSRDGGLNAPEGFDKLVSEEISKATGLKFCSNPNKFHGLTSHDAVVFLEGALKGLAAVQQDYARPKDTADGVFHEGVVGAALPT